MSTNRCFETLQTTIVNGSDHTNTRRQKTIYVEMQHNSAKNGPNPVKKMELDTMIILSANISKPSQLPQKSKKSVSFSIRKKLRVTIRYYQRKTVSKYY